MTCTQTDSKFQDNLIESRDASCRACANFIRVRHDIRNAHHMRGFCKLGGSGNVEFSLYQSSSESHSCPSLSIDDYNLETKKKEDLIQSEILEIREKIHNKRTKEYKLFKDFFDKSKKMVDKENRSTWVFTIMGNFLEEGATFYEWYYSLNCDRFQELWKRKALNESQYNLLKTNIVRFVENNITFPEYQTSPGTLLQVKSK